MKAQYIIIVNTVNGTDTYVTCYHNTTLGKRLAAETLAAYGATARIAYR